VSELVLASVVRIGTTPRVFRPTPTPDEVFSFVNAVRSPAATTRVSPGPRHWLIFQDLVVAADLRGAETTDAYLAALAIESGCEWWTTDRGFGRFPGLRWRNLVA
jgi:toxin-antitoxin system PIN domain toxin